MDGDQIVGIYSERDYARHASQQDKLLLEEPVVDHMRLAVYFVTPQQPIEECMMLMTSRHIRHIPVLEDETRLVGIISIGDVVKHVLEEKENTIVGLEYVHSWTRLQWVRAFPLKLKKGGENGNCEGFIAAKSDPGLVCDADIQRPRRAPVDG